MAGKKFCDRKRVVAMLLHAEWKRLDAGNDQESVEWGERRAEIAERKNARGDGEAEIAERVRHHDALIFGAWFRDHRIAVVARPFELAAVDQQATDRVAVAAEEFRR